jgi:subfamily B ATP-binding cassette protein MsbA
MEVLAALALAGLIALLGARVQSGSADAAHYISFLGAIFLLYDPLKKLGRVQDYIAAGAASLDRLQVVLRAPPGMVSGTRHFKDVAAHVQFERVSFAYEERQVLQEVSLEILPGQCVALVGPSGGGKSTLAALLPRFYDPQAGSVRLGGQDVREATLASLRACMALVRQETFLFNASVRDNIGYGRADATGAQVEAAARAADAHDFIALLPLGYDTVLGERGHRLSGGQKQRIAIARALVRDAPILILDEATSHLDVESERAIQAALNRLMSGRTVLMIAHRLSTVSRADCVYVMEAGRVVESGGPAELLLRGGRYAQLVRQAG